MDNKPKNEQSLHISGNEKTAKDENSNTKGQDIDELIELEDMLDELADQISNFRHVQKPPMSNMKLSYHNGTALDDE
ncbi:MAG: hypothetical protein AB7W47_11040 [Calditrichaceae bacterium]